MASYYRVDPKAEPHLLWIVRQVRWDLHPIE